MPETLKNVLTDTLGLVEIHHIPRVRILPQAILPENGFSLELYRNGLHQGSTHSGQGMHASGGDTIYRINLGPANFPLTGLLVTEDGYTREYSMIVMLQVIEPTPFIELYRQSRDPVHLVQIGIQEAIQTYAHRTRYEQMHATNLEAKAKYAFDGDVNKLRAGIRIVGIYQPFLKANKDYTPVINYSPTLTLEGPIRTLDGYLRTYKLTVEFEVIDQGQYRQLNQEGAEPLKLAQLAIKGQIERYALQQREEDLTETSMREEIESSFSTLSNRVASCLKIVRTHSLSLEGTLLNSSPLLVIKGQVTTRDKYVRPYELSVELKITNPRRYQQIQFEGSDPLEMAREAIMGELQAYARQQFYHDLSEPGLRSIVEHAFDEHSSRIVECIKVTYTHRLILQEDSTYRPLNRSPLLQINGQLTTRGNYKRNYSLTVELFITNQQHYLQLMTEGTDPLELARTTIAGELQKATHDQFYEDFSEAQLRTIVEHAFDQLSNRVTGGLQIVRTHDLSLGEDSSYQPLNLSPLLQINGQLTTRENYKRNYSLTVELLITNRQHHVQLVVEGADPLELARMTIAGELQRATHDQFYEDFSEAQLRTIVEHAFDQLSNRVTGGLQIVRTHDLSLGEDSTYRPLNLSPLLHIANQLITREGYERSYKVSVALQIVEPRRYQQLIYEGSDPLEHVKMSIHSELQKYARDLPYEDFTEARLSEVIERTLEQSPNNLTSVLKVARAYDLSLSADPHYVHLGSRTITITGQIRTYDYRVRSYEVTVELEVGNATDFVRLVRQGDNPLDLTNIAIKGAIQRATEHKTHDELSTGDIAEAAREAFHQIPNHTIGGLKLVKPYQVSLLVDPRIQEEHDIDHNARIEDARKRNQARQSKVDIDATFEAKALELEKAHELLLLEQSLQERKNSFSSSQEMAAKLNTIYMNSIEEDLKERLANGQSILELIRETKSAQQLLSSPGQTSWRSTDGKNPQRFNEQEVESYVVEVKQAERGIPHSDPVHPSVSTRKTINIPQWGVLLKECPLPPELFDIAGGQRAFQVLDITDEAQSQNSPFQDLDILMKINGQKAYTREAIEAIFSSLQFDLPVKVQVLREGFGTLLTLNVLSDDQNREKNIDTTIE